MRGARERRMSREARESGGGVGLLETGEKGE